MEKKQLTLEQQKKLWRAIQNTKARAQEWREWKESQKKQDNQPPDKEK